MVKLASASSHRTLSTVLCHGQELRVLEHLPHVLVPTPLPNTHALDHQCGRCLEWALKAGIQVLPAMWADVFYLGDSWTQWKPLNTPGTHIPGIHILSDCLKLTNQFIKKLAGKTIIIKTQSSHLLIHNHSA